MTAAELSDLQLDRLLAQVPSPASPAADLTDRIAAHALRTRQERGSRFSIPRRHSPRRRPALWTAVIATNLVAAAAAAATWDGQQFDFRRLTELPHRVAAAIHVGRHHLAPTEVQRMAARPVVRGTVLRPGTAPPAASAPAAQPLAITHTSGTIAHVMAPAPLHFRAVRHRVQAAHAPAAAVRIARAPFAATDRPKGESALDERAARRTARAAERALLPEANGRRNGFREQADGIAVRPRQPAVAPQVAQHQQLEPERRAIDESAAAADRSPPSTAPAERPENQTGMTGERRARQWWRQMHPRAREGRGRRRGRF